VNAVVTGPHDAPLSYFHQMIFSPALVVVVNETYPTLADAVKVVAETSAGDWVANIDQLVGGSLVEKLFVYKVSAAEIPASAMIIAAAKSIFFISPSVGWFAL
jgi:hypothetical protein